MNGLSDSQLLRSYMERHSEPAFAELVRRHVDIVYSAALRMVCDSHLAEDVTQGVFLALAKNARELAELPVLSGWLHRTARNIAAQTVRSDIRRRAREQEAAAMNEPSAEPGTSWHQIAPHLDAALADLNDMDRDAILLRYFHGKSAREMAEILGVSDAAAQKRVTRATERLRDGLSNQGVTVGTGALIALITVHAVQAAPVGLGVAISATAFAGITVTATTLATHTIMKVFIVKTAVPVLAAAIAAGTGVFFVQQREANQLRSSNTSLLTEHAALRKERDDALMAVKTGATELDRLKGDQLELMRLRGEVGRLRRQAESSSPQAPPPVAAARANPRSPSHPPGTYITSDQIENGGYATPESALETMTWGLMHGTYDQVNEGLKPEMRELELRDPKNRETFPAQQAQAASMFKGMQILAKKTLADDKIELKVQMDYDMEAMKKVSPRLPPPYMIQPMVKVGDEWKLGGSTREFKDQWNDGAIQTFVP